MKRKVKQAQNCKVTNGNSERKILSSENEEKKNLKFWKNNKTKFNSTKDNLEIKIYPSREKFFCINSKNLQGTTVQP